MKGPMTYGPQVNLLSTLLLEKNQKTFFDFWEVGEVQGMPFFVWGQLGKFN